MLGSRVVRDLDDAIERVAGQARGEELLNQLHTFDGGCIVYPLAAGRAVAFMNVTNQIALVTGANRGIGRQYVLELLERGVGKVYATARRPGLLDFEDSRVVPLRLDLLEHESVAAAAVAARDVTLLINNAGISVGATLVTGGSVRFTAR